MAASAELKKAFQEARTEFKELSIGELKEFEKFFLKYDTCNDGFIDLQELKYMMEKLGHSQTHLDLKAMIKEVDEDQDEKISYREFLLIFRYARDGTLKSAGLREIANANIDVQKEGVGGAKNFFEQKAKALNESVADKDRAYHEEKKKEAEEKKVRQAAFKEKAAAFK